LRVFLLSLAIVDDIGAILVIAVFYAEAINPEWLALGACLLGLIATMRYVGIRYVPAYALVGIAVWLATLESGIHATIAGVAIAFLTPAKPLTEEVDEVPATPDAEGPLETRRQILHLRETVAPAERLAHLLHPWTSFVVLPIFALANAGLVLSLEQLGDAVTSRVTLGVALGLVVGKILGISGATLVARRTGLGTLPAGVTTRQIVAVSAVAGIGFTVSLFVTSLAFTNPGLLSDAKVGVLAASLLAALLAYVILRLGQAPAVSSARDD
jgi:Na+:H+ antiporter, NhaA family